MSQDLYGLILGGGKSTRMGRDKALLSYHSKPQVEFIYDLLSQFCSQVFLSKRPEQNSYQNIPAINDSSEFSDLGPLSGILSAMQTHPGISWLVMACDLPFVNEEVLRKLMAHRQIDKFATAFISTSNGLPEPLCAIWEAKSFAKILALSQEGIKCPRKILIKSATHLITQDHPQWLDNINTPEEYNKNSIMFES